MQWKLPLLIVLVASTAVTGVIYFSQPTDTQSISVLDVTNLADVTRQSGTILSSQRGSFQVDSITGIEAEYFDVHINGDRVCLIPKQWDIALPTSLPIYNSSGAQIGVSVMNGTVTLVDDVLPIATPVDDVPIGREPIGNVGDVGGIEIPVDEEPIDENITNIPLPIPEGAEGIDFVIPPIDTDYPQPVGLPPDIAPLSYCLDLNPRTIDYLRIGEQSIIITATANRFPSAKINISSSFQYEKFRPQIRTDLGDLVNISVSQYTVAGGDNTSVIHGSHYINLTHPNMTHIISDPTLKYYFAFDNATGYGESQTVVKNYMNLSDTITIDNEAQLGNGLINKGYLFDGVGDRISTGYDAIDLGGLATLSWGLWANNTLSTGNQQEALIVGGSFALTSNGNVLLINYDTGEHMECGIRGDDELVYKVDGPVAIDEGEVWRHTFCTFNGTSLRIYNNGEFFAETVTADTTTDTSASDAVEIGHVTGTSTTGGGWTGELDEIMIFNRTLSAEEVANVFMATNPNPYSQTSGGRNWTHITTEANLTVPLNRSADKDTLNKTGYSFVEFRHFASDADGTYPSINGTVTIDYFHSGDEGGGGDSCTPASSHPVIYCNDFCVLSGATITVSTGDLNISNAQGAGEVNLSTIINFTGTDQKINIEPMCTLNTLSGGAIE